MDDWGLNVKIIELITKLGVSSSQFADYVTIKRPILSHILNKRNKPSLEIIQKICRAFPELGMEWTFDGNQFDAEMLIKIAVRLREENQRDQLAKIKGIDIFGSKSEFNVGTNEIFSLFSGSQKKIKRILVLFEDNTFTEYDPAKI